MARIEFELKTKEQFRTYLASIIEYTQKFIWRHDAYLKDIEKIINKKINSLSIENLNPESLIELIQNDNYSTEQREKILPLMFSEYIRVDERMKYIELRLNNIIGDDTKDAASYKKFRKLAKKFDEKGNGEQLNLPVQNQAMQELINSIYKARNFTAHISDASIIAKQEYRLNQIKDLEKVTGSKIPPITDILINKYDYVDIERLFTIYIGSYTNKRHYREIFRQMKRDYTKLSGKSNSIKIVPNGTLDIEYEKITHDAFNMKKKMKK